ncbi:hypothetical protein CFBP5507_04455 [Agrobacterium salinitolerans]|uniref:Uncharacterized protein n=1 Tax=Agrobacterium salinitolerans TaxID=1183413 RepID=A0A4Z1RC72_9HYPH|nr:hypothetical protein [Agrobacterium salinitolerans]UYZ08265.1 hypothetical protein CFBP5507_04455 [Agrobacterium salinitolerans]
MALKIANNAVSTLAASITDTAVTLSVQAADAGKFPVLAEGDWHPATIIDAANNLEIVHVTARAGNVLTVLRAQEGTTAKSFVSGARIDLRITAGAIAALANKNELKPVAYSGSFTDLTDKPPSITTSTVGAAVAAANGKETPADGDTFAGVESGTSSMFRTTWGNIKTALTSLFDGRYLKLTGGAIDGGLAIRSGGPTLNLVDTDNNQSRSVHHNDAIIGFLNSSGSWTLQVNDNGHVWSANYGWFHDRFAQAGANCQHNSGVVEFSGFDTGITDSVGQASNPYVVIGLRRGNTGLGNASYLRCVALRNR